MGKPKIININFFRPGDRPQRRQHNLDKPWRLFRTAWLGAFEDFATWEDAMKARGQKA